MAAVGSMNLSKEMVGCRWWAGQVDRNNACWSVAPATDRLLDAVDVGRADSRHLQQLEKALQRTDIARASLVRSWWVVRKRIMKKTKGGVGPSEAFRKEAVRRYLEKKRRRSEEERREDIVMCDDPMDESPF